MTWKLNNTSSTVGFGVQHWRDEERGLSCVALEPVSDAAPTEQEARERLADRLIRIAQELRR